MNPLEQLQEDVTAMLLGNPETGFVPFSIYRKQVIASVQDEAAAAWKVRVPNKVGLACLTLMPSLRVVTPNVPGPQYDVALIVRCFHDPRVNNTGMSAEQLGMAVLRWLDGQIFEGVTQLHGDDRGEALKPNYDFPGMLVYDCTLVGPMPQDILGRTAAPDITDDDAGTVTLTCNDGAAEIWFTTDGSCPMPDAAAAAGQAEDATTGAVNTAQRYVGPFQVLDGTAVSCLAWNRAGYLPSHLARGTINIP